MGFKYGVEVSPEQLTVTSKNNTGKRKAYKDEESNIYLDCKHCGIAPIENFGSDKRGFMGRRAECTLCRRRTDGHKILNTKVKIIVEEVEIEVTINKITQAGRKSYIDKFETIYLDCTKCSFIGPLNAFYSDPKSLYDKHSHCKSCVDESNRKWEVENKEHAIQIQRDYYRNNIEEIRRKSKERRNRNQEKIKLARKKYLRENKLKIYWKKKKDREQNPEKHKLRIENWIKNNPEKHKLLSQRRLARQKMLPDTLTEEQLITVMKKYNGSCCLTGINEDVTIDHVVPLFTGHGGTIYENVIPLTRKLNSSKQEKNIFEWAELLHEYYGFTMERFYEVIQEVAERNNMTIDEYKTYYFSCFENCKSVNIEILNKGNTANKEALDKATKLYVESDLSISEILEVTNITLGQLNAHLRRCKIERKRRKNRKKYYIKGKEKQLSLDSLI
ncbi:hypothetical protein bcgnr5378_06680 [Bacillus cereus]|uniref:HNH nuclease domain-containing protein n=1 Tax=Bacillus cereus TaxID=1396 RepID=A0A164L9H5_BACCE|nr:hypothetical protein [Bacillus cereus]KZD55571.1 hypothetical protein B4088_5316 [Bacillus cereus]